MPAPHESRSKVLPMQFPKAMSRRVKLPLPLGLVKITGQPAERREAEEDWG
jgi:hypothetical protein